MRTTDRLLVLTAIVVACLALLRIGGSSGVADPVGHWLETLGPAKSLELTGTDPLLVRNADGRIGWGEEPTSRAWSIGSVHIDDVIKKLLQTEDYLGEREELQTELKEIEAEFNERAQEIQGEYGEIGEDDPQFPEAQGRMQALMQEYQQFTQLSRGRITKLEAEQLERSYRELIEATEIVADQRSIDFVFRFIPTAEAFGTQNAEQAMLQIQLRTFLKYPEAVDITGQVIEELDLE